jgi:hypothetical protein
MQKVINNAKKWLYKHKTGSSWTFPVISECPVSTALSLFVVDDKTRYKAIEYLMNTKVWERNLYAAGIFVLALKEIGDYRRAEKVLHLCEKEIKKPEKKSKVLHHQVYHDKMEKLLEELKYAFPLGINERDLSTVPLYSLLFKLTPQKWWYDRTSYFHDFFPTIAPMLISKNNFSRANKKVVNALKKALNADGSYGGVTGVTIMSTYALRQLGEDAEESLKWLEKARNENGSFRPLFCQNVYDTAWVCLALAELGEDVRDALEWLESKKVAHGYPYVASGYFPDPDDTSLVLLLKKHLNCINADDHESLDFIIKIQNPDGGWSYCPLYKHPIRLKFLSLIINGLGLFTTSQRRGYGFLAMFHPTRNYISTIDMTARALITLSYFKDLNGVKKSINMGIKYLLKYYSNGRFRASHRWTFSDIYETSMALIALYKNGVKNEKTSSAMKWVLSQKIEFAEDAAHVLWALIEGNYEREYMDKMVKIIAEKQLPDGSWQPNVGFFLGSAKYYSLFSIAAPLYALALYEKNTHI